MHDREQTVRLALVLALDLVGTLAIGLSSVCGQDDRHGAPPQLMKFESFDAASQTLQLVQAREVQVPSLFKEVTPDGRTVERIAYITETQEIIQSMITKDLRVLTLKGEPLKVAETLGKLKKGTPVLAVSAGKLVPKAFLPLFKDDVIVLELPPFAPPPPPGK